MADQEVEILEGRTADRGPGHRPRIARDRFTGCAASENLHLAAKASGALMSEEPRILVAVTGASGVVYTQRLLEVLGDRADVILTKDAVAVIEVETGMSAKEFGARAHATYRDDDLSASPASGSHPFRAFVVVPCSGTTLAKIASGIADNLVTRAAAVALKEHRPLILVPRETPVSAIALENALKLARLGVIILPASPGFYGKPKRIEDLVDFVVARILDQLGVPHGIGIRWTGPPE